MATFWFSEPAEKELKRFATEDQQEVAEAISLVEGDIYREQNKLDLNLVEQGFKIYSLIVGGVWLGFHDDTNGDICVDWVSLRSRFRS
jgi:hypothetical protein